MFEETFEVHQILADFLADLDSIYEVLIVELPSVLQMLIIWSYYLIGGRWIDSFPIFTCIITGYCNWTSTVQTLIYQFQNEDKICD